MTQPLAITLHASGEEVASGVSGVVDIASDETTRSAARLSLVLAAIDDGSASFFVETSLDGLTGWSEVGRFEILDASSASLPGAYTAELTAPGAHELDVGDLRRYLRVRWTLQDGAAAINFVVTGDAHVVYAGPAAIKRYSAAAGAWDDTRPSVLASAAIAATAKVATYLSGQYVLPITAWGEDLTLAAAQIAGGIALGARGYQPEGSDQQIAHRSAEAEKWCNRIHAGTLTPPGIIDSTPTTFEGGAFVVSDEPRGW